MPVPRRYARRGPDKLKMRFTVVGFGRTTFGASCSQAWPRRVPEIGRRNTPIPPAFANALGILAHQQNSPVARRRLYSLEAIRVSTASLIIAAWKIICGDGDAESVQHRSGPGCWSTCGVQGLWLAQPISRPAFERMLLPTREQSNRRGANEVLTSFIALVRIARPGRPVPECRSPCAIHGASGARLFWHGPLSAGRRAPDSRAPQQVRPLRRSLGKLIPPFQCGSGSPLFRLRRRILERQYAPERIAPRDELCASACP